MNPRKIRRKSAFSWKLPERNPVRVCQETRIEIFHYSLDIACVPNTTILICIPIHKPVEEEVPENLKRVCSILWICSNSLLTSPKFVVWCRDPEHPIRRKWYETNQGLATAFNTLYFDLCKGYEFTLTLEEDWQYNRLPGIILHQGVSFQETFARSNTFKPTLYSKV